VAQPGIAGLQRRVMCHVILDYARVRLMIDAMKPAPVSTLAALLAPHTNRSWWHADALTANWTALHQNTLEAKRSTRPSVNWNGYGWLVSLCRWWLRKLVTPPVLTHSH